MVREPALSAAKQLLHLGLIDPVVLVGVEDRHEHVQVGQQVMKTDGPLEIDREVTARSPLRELVVQRMVLSADGVAEGLEESPQDLLTARAGEDSEMRRERNGRIREVGVGLGLAAEGSVEHA